MNKQLTLLPPTVRLWTVEQLVADFARHPVYSRDGSLCLFPIIWRLEAKILPRAWISGVLSGLERIEPYPIGDALMVEHYLAGYAVGFNAGPLMLALPRHWSQPQEDRAPRWAELGAAAGRDQAQSDPAEAWSEAEGRAAFLAGSLDICVGRTTYDAFIAAHHAAYTAWWAEERAA